MFVWVVFVPQAVLIEIRLKGHEGSPSRPRVNTAALAFRGATGTNRLLPLHSD